MFSSWWKLQMMNARPKLAVLLVLLCAGVIGAEFTMHHGSALLRGRIQCMVGIEVHSYWHCCTIPNGHRSDKRYCNFLLSCQFAWYDFILSTVEPTWRDWQPMKLFFVFRDWKRKNVKGGNKNNNNIDNNIYIYKNYTYIQNESVKFFTYHVTLSPQYHKFTTWSSQSSLKKRFGLTRQNLFFLWRLQYSFHFYHLRIT
jgi:hypothetical protein